MFLTSNFFIFYLCTFLTMYCVCLLTNRKEGPSNTSVQQAVKRNTMLFTICYSLYAIHHILYIWIHLCVVTSFLFWVSLLQFLILNNLFLFAPCHFTFHFAIFFSSFFYFFHNFCIFCFYGFLCLASIHGSLSFQHWEVNGGIFSIFWTAIKDTFICIWTTFSSFANCFLVVYVIIFFWQTSIYLVKTIIRCTITLLQLYIYILYFNIYIY